MQLPHLFSLEKMSDFQRRRFTSIDGVKYIQIKVIGCHKPISIPFKVFESRTAAQRHSNTTSQFLHYLRQQQQEGQQNGGNTS